MKKTQALYKLGRILEKDLPDLEKKLIITEDNGYSVFGRYHISKEKTGFVVYKNHSIEGVFSALRSAMSYCTADNHGNYMLGFDIKRLDRHKSLLENDLHARSKTMEKIRDPDIKEIIRLKIETRKTHLKNVSDRLDKCVNLAKYWQLQGFDNETARTGRQATIRTNR